MSVEWDINCIAQSFANAALGRGTWQCSLDMISEKVGAAGAVLVPLKGNLPPLPTSAGFAEAIDVYLRDGWSENDVRFRGVGAMRRKGYATDLDIISEREIRRSPYYQEWLHPFGLKWFAGVRIAGLEEEWVLSLQRSEAQGPFSEEECDRLVKMAHSLSASAELSNALGFSRADAAMAAFTMSGKAVVMLNRQGEVILTNSAAESIFDSNLRIKSKRLVCSHRESGKALDLAVHKACTMPDDCFDAPTLLMRADKGPLLAFVSPARGVANDVLSPCQAVVILADPYHRGVPQISVLQDLFGLTRAEAVLAAKLCKGHRLRDIASASGISYETGRTHLKRIFPKLGVKDQADLVALLLRLEVAPQ